MSIDSYLILFLLKHQRISYHANQILAQAGLPIPKTMLTRFPCKSETS